ncbi:hypothetical protein [Patulibacter sp.]|uniref:hypothetical protein n=1 Tax=Patulibacter sp. TaxID=1912859 RepID=UPI002719CB20|nr:hypothetical protein [Patulibacter sp.]MDO9410081.1 hypothetical protein [Patulibacter sp.]
MAGDEDENDNFGREFEVSRDEPPANAWAADARDSLREAQRLLARAREEITVGELLALRADLPRLAADAKIVADAVTAEAQALDAAVRRTL